MCKTCIKRGCGSILSFCREPSCPWTLPLHPGHGTRPSCHLLDSKLNLDVDVASHERHTRYTHCAYTTITYIHMHVCILYTCTEHRLQTHRSVYCGPPSGPALLVGSGAEMSRAEQKLRMFDAGACSLHRQPDWCRTAVLASAPQPK